MAGYVIGSQAGKDIANKLATGQQHKASDGSTWTKNSDGSVSVVTKNGGYTANAYQSPVSSVSYNSPSQSPSYGGGGSNYSNNNYSNGYSSQYSNSPNVDKFFQDNWGRVAGLAANNSVDLGVAKGMLVANITGAGNYKGGGVANMNQLAQEYRQAQAADRALNQGTFFGIGTGGGSGGGFSNQSQQNMIEQLYKAQEEAQIAALRQRVNQQVADYNSQLGQLPQQYQDAKNQVELGRHQSERVLREQLANAGLSSSGASRSERLNLESNYNNSLAGINAAEASAVSALKKAIADTQAAGSAEEVGLINTNAVSRLKAQIDAAEQEAERSREDFINSLSLGAYSSDYQAKINDILNDGDPTNDWQVPYLQGYRNQKIAQQEADRVAQEQQAFENQLALAKAVSSNTGSRTSTLSVSDALKMYNDGLITPAVISTLGLNTGTTGGTETTDGGLVKLDPFAQGLLDDFKRGIAYEGVRPSDVVAAVRSFVNSGRLEEREAIRILNEIGINDK